MVHNNIISSYCVCNGKDIAAKKLHPPQGLDDKAFDSEFRNLNKVKHENVVQLLGYCYQVVKKYVPYNGELVLANEKDRILCFEYMDGKSLDKYIAGMIHAAPTLLFSTL